MYGYCKLSPHLLVGYTPVGELAASTNHLRPPASLPPNAGAHPEYVRHYDTAYLGKGADLRVVGHQASIVPAYQAEFGGRLQGHLD